MTPTTRRLPRFATDPIGESFPLLPLLPLILLFSWFCGFAAVRAADLPTDLLAEGNARPGLCVVLEPADAASLVTLRGEGRFVVQGLARDAATVERLRQDLRKATTYGPVSVDTHDLTRLPYADNLADAVVAADFAPLRKQGLTLAEVARVLTPYGTAYLRGVTLDEAKKELGGGKDAPALSEADGWLRIAKPFPATMDEWTQYAHDAARSYTSRDTLAGPLESIRWIAGETIITGRYVSPNVISAGGRVFFRLQDRGYKGAVECRNGFNGVLLWRTPPQEGIGNFMADGERLYVLKSNLEAWDAATGKPLFQFEHPPLVWPGMLLDEKSGVLVLACCNAQWMRGYEAKTGKELWKAGDVLKGWGGGAANGFAAVAGDRLYYACQKDEGDGADRRTTYWVRGLDLRTGQTVAEIRNVPEAGETLAAVSQSLDGKLVITAQAPNEPKNSNLLQTYIVSPADGRILWRTVTDGGVVRNGGFFFLQDSFWTRNGRDLVGYDPATGTVRKTVTPVKGWEVHMGCNPMSGATAKYLIGGRMHFIDPIEEKVFQYTCTRTPCRDSVRVANGLTYFPRHTCPCGQPMNGNIAIGAVSLVPQAEEADTSPARFRTGPAYGKATVTAAAAKAEWPTYRANAMRGSVVADPLPSTLAAAWTARLGTNVSAPVVAVGRVYAAAMDEHAVVALDAATGQEVWRRTVGGRVDSPPTVHEGLVLFGSRDGRLYCLRAEDGELAWAFRVAPDDRRIVVNEQVESVWPVYGSVLVEQGLVYACAGRHVDIDGGLSLYALEPATGKVAWKQPIRNKDHSIESAISSRLRGEGAINDILRSDGRNVYMAGDNEKVAFDLKTGERVRAPEVADLADARVHAAELAAKKPALPADAKGLPVNAIDGTGFVTDWALLGPLTAADGDAFEQDLLAPLGGETNGKIAWPEGPDATLGTPVLVRAEAETGIVIPTLAKSAAKAPVAYAVCHVTSDRDRVLRAVAAAGGGMKMWVNGQQVLARRDKPRLIRENDFHCRVALAKGENTVLVKLDPGLEPWRFYVLLTDAPATPILSTPSDLLVPARNRALTGTPGDPTNSSAVWVCNLDPERPGVPWEGAVKRPRFEMADAWGYPADLMAFGGERVFGIGREQDAKRTQVAVFGKSSATAKTWFADPADHYDRIQGLLVAGDTVVTAFGGEAVEDLPKKPAAKDAAKPPEQNTGTELTEIPTKSRLVTWSAADGAKRSELELPGQPRWDGLAAAAGRLYVATEDGRIVCLAKKP